jgi:hypothetical protein
MYGGVEVQLHAFLISAFDGCEWSVSRLSRFIPGEIAPDFHWIRVPESVKTLPRGDGRVTNELERMWKETVMKNFKVLSSHSLEKLVINNPTI